MRLILSSDKLRGNLYLCKIVMWQVRSLHLQEILILSSGNSYVRHPRCVFYNSLAIYVCVALAVEHNYLKNYFKKQV